MIARHVTMRLKTNTAAEFTQMIEKEIVPVLRKQKGFEDEITFIGPGAREALGISFWDKLESADAYNRVSYPDVLKTLAKVLDGTPQVQTWEVANSTSHKIATAVAA